MVVGEGEGGVEVIRTGSTRMPVQEDGTSAFYVFFSWMYHVDVFIAEDEVAVSKYRAMRMGQPRSKEDRVKSTDFATIHYTRYYATAVHVAQNISYQSMQDCLHGFVSPGRSFIDCYIILLILSRPLIVCVRILWYSLSLNLPSESARPVEKTSFI